MARIWTKYIRPEIKEIIYLFVGFVLGLFATTYFNYKSEADRRMEILQSAIYEIDLNTMVSWLPMYFDSASYVSAGTPYPLLATNALSTVFSNLPFLEKSFQSDKDREQFKKAITYAMMELEEFNMRINLRNQSGINGPIHSSHNAHAFNSFQTRVLPALLKLRAQLEKLH